MDERLSRELTVLRRERLLLAERLRASSAHIARLRARIQALESVAARTQQASAALTELRTALTDAAATHASLLSATEQARKALGSTSVLSSPLPESSVAATAAPAVVGPEPVAGRPVLRQARGDRETKGRRPAKSPVVRLADAPVAIDVAGLSKGFRVPSRRVTTLRERFLKHPFGLEYKRLEVLKDISFRVRTGEFVGVVGANGAGKSTLLKLLAGTYRADGGVIRVAGRVAPLIELGVGFVPDLSARDNVILNGALLGLSPREAERRYEEILEFAGLADFAELSLRNYSSGMIVRLGFAVTVTIEANVLLIDEVLAVGDAEFQERCLDVLGRRRREGTTILLVSHSMEKVAHNCDRAILIEGGRVGADGDPAEVGRSYADVMRAHARLRSDSASAIVGGHA